MSDGILPARVCLVLVEHKLLLNPTVDVCQRGFLAGGVDDGESDQAGVGVRRLLLLIWSLLLHQAGTRVQLGQPVHRRQRAIQWILLLNTCCM